MENSPCTYLIIAQTNEILPSYTGDPWSSYCHRTRETRGHYSVIDTHVHAAKQQLQPGGRISLGVVVRIIMCISLFIAIFQGPVNHMKMYDPCFVKILTYGHRFYIWTLSALDQNQAIFKVYTL